MSQNQVQSYVKEGVKFIGEIRYGSPYRGNWFKISDGSPVINKNVIYCYGEYPKASYYILGVRTCEGSMPYGFLVGSGKLFHRNGNPLYEGEFKKGVFDGHGVVYDHIKNTIYEGQFLCGKFDGIGKKYYAGTKFIQYEGQYKNGVMVGKGKYYFKLPEKIVMYKGHFGENKFNGNGRKYYMSRNLEYDGEFKNGLFDGKGKKYLDSKSLKLEFDGEFAAGKFVKGIRIKFDGQSVTIDTDITVTL